MYVIVQHAISEPVAFWKATDPTMLPPALKLHHTFPVRDGKRAVCLWEAASVDAVRDFLEPLVGRFSRNEYFEVPNREGVAMPADVQVGARAQR